MVQHFPPAKEPPTMVTSSGSLGDWENKIFSLIAVVIVITFFCYIMTREDRLVAAVEYFGIFMLVSIMLEKARDLIKRLMGQPTPIYSSLP